LTAFVDFEQKQPGHSNCVSRIVENLLTFGDSLGYAVDCLVCVIFREGTPAPFKETREIGSDFEILLGGAVAIATERNE
jgi:hypothetical protein